LQGQCVQDLNQRCLSDARVEIVGGPMSGLATMTVPGGFWSFYGVSGVTQVRVSKDGYIAAVQDVRPPPAGQIFVGLCGPVLAPNGSTAAIPAATCSD
jgi:hypothetical protein